MNFDWLQFLEIAKVLAKEPGQEYQQAYYRTAISRAYYAVFCFCRDKKGLTTYKPQKRGDYGTHEKVIRTYKEDLLNYHKKIGTKLDELRRWRNIADYQGDKVIQRDLILRALNEAEEIINLLQSNG